MPKTKPFKNLSEPLFRDSQRRKRMQQIEKDMDAIELAELRNSMETTQKELARVLNTSQENISRIERQEDLYLSTLSEYVAGLGGHLEISAVFDKHKISIKPSG